MLEKKKNNNKIYFNRVSSRSGKHEKSFFSLFPFHPVTCTERLFILISLSSERRRRGIRWRNDEKSVEIIIRDRRGSHTMLFHDRF